jgi:MerR family copper efflux transcriptional regulator
MDGLTIQEAAQTTGWSPRMLRYIERIGLVEPTRSAAGYRLYGPAQLQRLRTLRELLSTHDLGLGDVGLALRLRRDPTLRAAVNAWLDATPSRPADVAPANWLRWEQEKHEKLLAAADAGGPTLENSARTHAKESA